MCAPFYLHVVCGCASTYTPADVCTHSYAYPSIMLIFFVYCINSVTNIHNVIKVNLFLHWLEKMNVRGGEKTDKDRV